MPPPPPPGSRPQGGASSSPPRLAPPSVRPPATSASTVSSAGATDTNAGGSISARPSSPTPTARKGPPPVKASISKRAQSPDTTGPDGRQTPPLAVPPRPRTPPSRTSTPHIEVASEYRSTNSVLSTTRPAPPSLPPSTTTTTTTTAPKSGGVGVERPRTPDRRPKPIDAPTNASNINTVPQIDPYQSITRAEPPAPPKVPAPRKPSPLRQPEQSSISTRVEGDQERTLVRSTLPSPPPPQSGANNRAESGSPPLTRASPIKRPPPKMPVANGGPPSGVISNVEASATHRQNSSTLPPPPPAQHPQSPPAKSAAETAKTTTSAPPPNSLRAPPPNRPPSTGREHGGALSPPRMAPPPSNRPPPQQQQQHIVPSSSGRVTNESQKDQPIGSSTPTAAATSTKDKDEGFGTGGIVFMPPLPKRGPSPARGRHGSPFVARNGGEEEPSSATAPSIPISRALGSSTPIRERGRAADGNNNSGDTSMSSPYYQQLKQLARLPPRSETLASIAERTGTSVEVLMSLNPHLKRYSPHTDVLPVGTTVHVPATNEATVNIPKVTDIDGEKERKEQHHQQRNSEAAAAAEGPKMRSQMGQTGEQGESLLDVAKSTNTTVKELLRCNPHLIGYPLDKPLQPGTQLTLPDDDEDSDDDDDVGNIGAAEDGVNEESHQQPSDLARVSSVAPSSPYRDCEVNTLHRINKHYGVGIGDLIAANVPIFEAYQATKPIPHGTRVNVPLLNSKGTDVVLKIFTVGVGLEGEEHLFGAIDKHEDKHRDRAQQEKPLATEKSTNAGLEPLPKAETEKEKQQDHQPSFTSPPSTLHEIFEAKAQFAPSSVDVVRSWGTLQSHKAIAEAFPSRCVLFKKKRKLEVEEDAEEEEEVEEQQELGNEEEDDVDDSDAMLREEFVDETLWSISEHASLPQSVVDQLLAYDPQAAPHNERRVSLLSLSLENTDRVTTCEGRGTGESGRLVLTVPMLRDANPSLPKGYPKSRWLPLGFKPIVPTPVYVRITPNKHQPQPSQYQQRHRQAIDEDEAKLYREDEERDDVRKDSGDNDVGYTQTSEAGYEKHQRIPPSPPTPPPLINNGNTTNNNNNDTGKITGHGASPLPPPPSLSSYRYADGLERVRSLEGETMVDVARRYGRDPLDVFAVNPTVVDEKDEVFDEELAGGTIICLPMPNNDDYNTNDRKKAPPSASPIPQTKATKHHDPELNGVVWTGGENRERVHPEAVNNNNNIVKPPQDIIATRPPPVVMSKQQQRDSRDEKIEEESTKFIPDLENNPHHLGGAQQPTKTILANGRDTLRDICNEHFLTEDQLRSMNPFMLRYYTYTVIPRNTCVVLETLAVQQQQQRSNLPAGAAANAHSSSGGHGPAIGDPNSGEMYNGRRVFIVRSPVRGRPTASNNSPHRVIDPSRFGSTNSSTNSGRQSPTGRGRGGESPYRQREGRTPTPTMMESDHHNNNNNNNGSGNSTKVYPRGEHAMNADRTELPVNTLESIAKSTGIPERILRRRNPSLSALASTDILPNDAVIELDGDVAGPLSIARDPVVNKFNAPSSALPYYDGTRRSVSAAEDREDYHSGHGGGTVGMELVAGGGGGGGVGTGGRALNKRQVVRVMGHKAAVIVGQRYFNKWRLFATMFSSQRLSAEQAMENERGQLRIALQAGQIKEADLRRRVAELRIALDANRPSTRPSSRQFNGYDNANMSNYATIASASSAAPPVGLDATQMNVYADSAYGRAASPPQQGGNVAHLGAKQLTYSESRPGAIGASPTRARGQSPSIVATRGVGGPYNNWAGATTNGMGLMATPSPAPNAMGGLYGARSGVVQQLSSAPPLVESRFPADRAREVGGTDLSAMAAAGAVRKITPLRDQPSVMPSTAIHNNYQSSTTNANTRLSPLKRFLDMANPHASASNEQQLLNAYSSDLASAMMPFGGGQRRSLGLLLNGLKVTRAIGAAAAAGVQPNDVVIRVGGQLVSSGATFKAIVDRERRPKVSLTVQTPSGHIFTTMLPLVSSNSASGGLSPSRTGSPTGTVRNSPMRFNNGLPVSANSLTNAGTAVHANSNIHNSLVAGPALHMHTASPALAVSASRGVGGGGGGGLNSSPLRRTSYASPSPISPRVGDGGARTFSPMRRVTSGSHLR